ncbi:uncharacterized protein LOC119743144 [Patiria miniata]|uniref:Uncharacterized protein n=1 Tax=Patiria miniata TaxID=46514 RepID=A0A914BHU0_PATMI|nr:uncharacterized protein LOC119743144 [Patiria miniata]
MSSVTQRQSPSVARCLWRGSWAQLVLQTTLLVLLLTTQYSTARPALMDYLPTDELSQRSAAETNFEGMDLRSLCARTRSVEVRVLCKLTTRGDRWSEVEGRKKVVNKRSDSSSLSAFQRLLSQLRTASESHSEALQQLQQLRDMGVIDENNQVISIPADLRAKMEQLG